MSIILKMRGQGEITMKSKLIDFTDKFGELEYLIENVDILTDDIYKEYFSVININKPGVLHLLEMQYKITSMRIGMVRDYMGDVMSRVWQLHKELIKLNDEYRENNTQNS